MCVLILIKSARFVSFLLKCAQFSATGGPEITDPGSGFRVLARGGGGGHTQVTNASIADWRSLTGTAVTEPRHVRPGRAVPVRRTAASPRTGHVLLVCFLPGH
jgi:hypothetical protein